MGNLKTLKDIKGIYSNGNNELGELHTNTEELRQEAIKWVKSDKSNFCSKEGMYETKDWIKMFFNL